MGYKTQQSLQTVLPEPGWAAVYSLETDLRKTSLTSQYHHRQSNLVGWFEQGLFLSVASRPVFGSDGQQPETQRMFQNNYFNIYFS